MLNTYHIYVLFSGFEAMVLRIVYDFNAFVVILFQYYSMTGAGFCAVD